MELPAGPRIEDDLVTLHVLGTRSGMPGPDEPSSGYVLDAGGTTMLFDCGPGIAGALTAPDRIDAVFISHLHADHCYDILPIGKQIVSPRVSYPDGEAVPEMDATFQRIPLYIPTGAVRTLLSLQGLFPVVSSPPLDHALELAFDMREYGPYDQMKVQSCVVTAVPGRHVIPTCGFRVDSPAGSFAYTGDTGWTDELLDLAQGVDLLLCEATLREEDFGPHGHLSATQAGALAAVARVGTLVLTHFSRTDSAWLEALRDDASSAFSGPVHIAEPGANFPSRTTREELSR